MRGSETVGGLGPPTGRSRTGRSTAAVDRTGGHDAGPRVPALFRRSAIIPDASERSAARAGYRRRRSGRAAVPVDHDRYGLPLREDFGRTVAGRARVGVDLDLAIDQVDDPVDRDPGGPVDLGGQRAVIRQAGVGDLDDQGDFVRPGVVILVIADRPPDDAAIGLGFAVPAGEPDRLGSRDVVPVGGDDPVRARRRRARRPPDGGDSGSSWPPGTR